LGNIETPFFGAPKKEKRGEMQGRTPFFAVPSVGLVGWWVECAALGFASAASRLYYVG
jgi:hypothetical protein